MVINLSSQRLGAANSLFKRINNKAAYLTGSLDTPRRPVALFLTMEATFPYYLQGA